MDGVHEAFWERRVHILEQEHSDIRTVMGGMMHVINDTLRLCVYTVVNSLAVDFN